MSRRIDIPGLADRALETLRSRGWLLQADSVLPNVAALVVGEPIRGSWWSHPEARLIYGVLQALENSHELIEAKLVKGKLTLVHRRLWPELISVACSGEAWQTRELSPSAHALAERTNREGTLRLDEMRAPLSAAERKGAARELELRLLVHAEDVHTGSGRHTKRLESWPHAMARLGLSVPLPSSSDAKLCIERLMPDGGHGLLPWLPSSGRAPSTRRVPRAPKPRES